MVSTCPIGIIYGMDVSPNGYCYYTTALESSYVASYSLNLFYPGPTSTFAQSRQRILQLHDDEHSEMLQVLNSRLLGLAEYIVIEWHEHTDILCV